MKKLNILLQLWLILMFAIAISITTVGGLMVWNLREGFNQYIQSQDIERLNILVQQLSDQLEQQAPTKDVAMNLLSQSNFMRKNLDHVAQQYDGLTPPDHALQAPPPDMMRASPPFNPQKLQSPDHQPPAFHPPRGQGFGDRLGIFTMNGDFLAGHSIAQQFVLTTKAIHYHGQEIALLKMFKHKPVQTNIERQFLLRQYWGLGFISIILIGLAAIIATFLAQRWVKPLLIIQQATKQIASGDLSIRVDQSRLDEIGDVARNLNQMTVELARIDRSRRRWISDISHELRTPLAILRGEIEAMLDGVRPTNLTSITSLQEEVLRLNRLVEDLHLLSMADLGSFPCQFMDVEARNLVINQIERFKSKANSQQIDLTLSDQSAGIINAQWDQGRIEQLMSNLLENSIRYTHKQGQIEVVLKMVEPHTLLLEVADSPPAPATEDIAYLFDPLYRADSARTKKGNSGSGLGLAICKAIVDAHAGRISASLSHKGGLLVSVWLPLNPVLNKHWLDKSH